MYDDAEVRVMVRDLTDQLEETQSVLAAAIEFDGCHDPKCKTRKGTARALPCNCYLSKVERMTMNVDPWSPRPERAGRREE